MKCWGRAFSYLSIFDCVRLLLTRVWGLGRLQYTLPDDPFQKLLIQFQEVPGTHGFSRIEERICHTPSRLCLVVVHYKEAQVVDEDNWCSLAEVSRVTGRETSGALTDRGLDKQSTSLAE